MTYKIESLNGCTRKISFNFETLDLSKEMNLELHKKQKNVDLKGFRKGKAPLSMVEKIFRPEIENEAINQFMSLQMFEALKAENLSPLGTPSVSNLSYQSEKSLKFDVMVEIFPQFEIKGVEKLSLKKAAVFFEEKELVDVRKNYMRSKAQMEEIKDAEVTVDDGHYTVLNFEGMMSNGEKLKELTAEEYVVEMGANQLLPEFEVGIKGMKKGEKKNIEVNFPEDYFEEKLKNQKVNFNVELLEIKEMKWPEFTDELAKEFGFDSVVDFDEKIRKNIMTQKEKESEQVLQQEILEQLIAKNPFDIPQTFVVQQRSSLKDDMTNNLQRQGLNDEAIAYNLVKRSDEIEKKAVFQVRSALILDKLAKDFKVEINDNDVDKKIEEVASTLGYTKEMVMKDFKESSQWQQQLRHGLKEEKVFAKIYELAKME